MRPVSQIFPLFKSYRHPMDESAHASLVFTSGVASFSSAVCSHFMDSSLLQSTLLLPRPIDTAPRRWEKLLLRASIPSTRGVN